jgi:hypothetical protein
MTPRRNQDDFGGRLRLFSNMKIIAAISAMELELRGTCEKGFANLGLRWDRQEVAKMAESKMRKAVAERYPGVEFGEAFKVKVIREDVVATAFRAMTAQLSEVAKTEMALMEMRFKAAAGDEASRHALNDFKTLGIL